MRRVRRKYHIAAGCLAAVLALRPACAAAKEPEEKLHVGLTIQDTEEGSTFYVLHENLKILEKLSGVAFDRNAGGSRGSATETVIYEVQDQIDAGMDGILLCPSTDEVLPAVCRMCEAAEVYWGIYFRRILDDEVREVCEASPYYIGNVYENEEDGAYQLAQKAIAEGYRHIALISEPKWDTTCELRERGIRRAVNEAGDVEILTEVRGLTSPQDVEESAAELLSAYPELDCIYLAGSKVAGAPEALCRSIRQEAGNREVGLVTMDFSGTLTEDFESGILKAAYGLPQLSLDPYYMAIKMVNVLKGYPPGDGFTSHCLEGIFIESAEEAGEMADVIENDRLLYFPEEYVSRELLGWNNPELSAKTLQKIMDENIRLENSVTGR